VLLLLGHVDDLALELVLCLQVGAEGRLVSAGELRELVLQRVGRCVAYLLPGRRRRGTLAPGHSLPRAVQVRADEALGRLERRPLEAAIRGLAVDWLCIRQQLSIGEGVWLLRLCQALLYLRVVKKSNGHRHWVLIHLLPLLERALPLWVVRGRQHSVVLAVLHDRQRAVLARPLRERLHIVVEVAGSLLHR
jgi:hypothetical protein